MSTCGLDHTLLGGHLAPGEERRYRPEIGALDGRDAIDAFARQTRELAVTPA